MKNPNLGKINQMVEVVTNKAIKEMKLDIKTLHERELIQAGVMAGMLSMGDLISKAHDRTNQQIDMVKKDSTDEANI